MVLRLAGIGLLAALLFASAAAGETIYKYRRADGQLIYSNRPLSDAAFVEQIDYEPASAVLGQSKPDKGLLEAEERIRKQLAARDQAWQELQDARLALARAEERLLVEIEPKADEPRQLTRSADAAPPAVGGPLPPARPAVGGPEIFQRPAVGGPMGRRQGGGGRSSEYQERVAGLVADVMAAQERAVAAQRHYNTLR